MQHRGGAKQEMLWQVEITLYELRKGGGSQTPSLRSSWDPRSYVNPVGAPPRTPPQPPKPIFVYLGVYTRAGLRSSWVPRSYERGGAVSPPVFVAVTNPGLT